MTRGRGQRGGDYLLILEALYRNESDDGGWVQGVADALDAGLSFGLGAFSYCWDQSSALPAQHIRASGMSPELLQRTLGQTGKVEGDRGRPMEATTRTQAALWVPAPRAMTFRSLPADVRADPLIQRQLMVVADCLGLRGTEPDGRMGLLAGIYSPTRIRLNASRRALLDRVASHFAAAYRLRTAIRSTNVFDAAEAVIKPNGRVEHVSVPERWEPAGEPERLARCNREARRDALVAFAREVQERHRAAYSLTRRGHREEAIRLWSALFDGRWSAVTSRDVDGKRFLVLVPNPAGERDPAALVPRQRQVLARALLGHSQKLIGYELGLAPPRVTEHLTAALRKIGARDLGEAIRTLRPRASEVTMAQGPPGSG